MAARLARRGGWLATVVSLAAAMHSAPLHEYLSRPDLLVPRLFVTTLNASAVAPGYVFLSPFSPELHPGDPYAADEDEMVNYHAGPMIYDNQGDLVWAGLNRTGQDDPPRKMFGTMGFEVCHFAEHPHLCFKHWQPDGPMVNEIVDARYETVRSVLFQGKTDGLIFRNDTHEFNIKSAPPHRSSTIYTEQTVIVSSVSNYKLPEPLHHEKCNLDIAWVQSSLFQEISLWTDEVLFQWDSMDHISLQDTHCPGNDGFWRGGQFMEVSWDSFHMNAVDRDTDGDFYVSGRHTSTIYKISGVNGTILWAIGEHGTFEMRSEVEGIPPQFGFQHHLRLHEDYPGYDLARGRIVLSLFDNANDHYDFSTKTSDFSSGKIFLIDETTRTATLKEAYTLSLDPRHQLATNQGSFQLLPNGNRILGGGNIQEIIEWQPGNPEPVFLAHWGDWEREDGSVGHKINSYRSLRYDWHGYPLEAPAVFAYALDCGAQLSSYISWNGATEVAQWTIWGGADPEGPFQDLGSANRTGFETRIASEFANYVIAIAWDSEGQELGRSSSTRVAVPTAVSGSAALPCHAERCESGFNYQEQASRDCAPVTFSADAKKLLPPPPNMPVTAESGAEGRHCDPCFPPFAQVIA